MMYTQQTARELLDRMHGSEDFKNLSYSDQRAVRHHWLTNVALQTPEAATLSRQDRAAIEREVYNAPPVLSSSATPAAAALMELATQARQGDTTAQNNALRRVFAINTASELGWQRKLYDFVGGLVEPLLREETTQRLSIDGDLAMYTPTEVGDIQAYNYLADTLAQDPDTRQRLSRAVTGGSFAGMGINIVSTVLASKATLGAAGGALVGNALAGKAATAAGAGKWLYGSVLPTLATQSIPEGVLFTLSEYYKTQYADEVWSEPDAASTVMKTLGVFGREVLFDIGFHQALRLGTIALSPMGKIFSRRGYRTPLPSDKPEEAVNLFKQFVNNELPENVASTLGGDELARVTRAKGNVALARSILNNDVPLTTDRYMRVLLAAEGFDLEDVAGKFRLTDISPTRVGPSTYLLSGEFDSLPRAFQSAQDYLDMLANKAAPAAAVGDLGATSAKVTIRETIEGTFTAAKGNVTSADVARLISPNRSGKIGGDNINELLRRTLGDQAPLNVRVIETTNEAFANNARRGQLVVRTPDGNLVVRSPRGPLSPTDAVTLQEGIAKFVRDTVGSAPPRATTATLRNIQRTVDQMNSMLKQVDVDLATRGATKAVEPTGAVRITEADGTVRRFVNEQAYVVDELAGSGKLTLATVNAHANVELGLNVVEHKGRFEVRRGTAVLRSGEGYSDLQAVLRSNPDLVPRITTPPGMQFVYGSAEGGTLKVNTHAINGSLQEVLDHANKTFTSGATKRRVLTSEAGKVIVTPQSRTFTVMFDDINFTREFGTLNEAKAFLRQGRDTAAMLKDVALAKGAHMDFVGNRWVITELGPNGRHFVANSLDEAKEAIAKLPPRLEAAIEVDLNLPQSFVDNVASRAREMFGDTGLGLPRVSRDTDLLEFVRHSKNYGSGQLPSTTKLATLIRPVNGILNEISEALGDSKIHESLFRKPMANYSVYRGSYMASVETIEALVKGASPSQRLFYNAALNAADPAALAHKMGLNFTSRDAEVIRALNSMLEVGKTQFNIDPYKWLTEYRPKLQEYLNHHAADLSGSASDVLTRATKGSIHPRDLSFFADNLRMSVQDLAELATPTDVVETMMGYFRMGYRARYLQPMLNEAYKVVDDLVSSGKIDMSIARYMTGFLQELTGTATDPAKYLIQEGISEAIGGLVRGLKIPNADKVTSSYVETLRSLATAAHMSWKPWMSIRNAQQVWGTLAPRFNNKAVGDAVLEVGRYGDDIIAQMRREGIIAGKAAIHTLDGATNNRLLKFFNDTGMRWMGNSDDYTRAVAWVTAKNEFSDALRRRAAWIAEGKLPNDVINERFMTMSGLEVLKPGDQEAIVARLVAGDETTALKMFQAQTVYDTMFGYVEATNPGMFKGHVIARLFGKYGHYSANYLENIRTMLGSHRKLGARARSAATLGINTLALHTAFEEVLGVNAASFNPVFQSTFGGGPYFSLMVQSLQATQQGYRGDIARSNLLGQWFRNTIPGASIMANLRIGADLINRGQASAGILRMMSLPMLDQDYLQRR